MSEYFTYNVFASQSSKNKAALAELAERLKSAGVRVWGDKWETRAGDNTSVRIAEGLEWFHGLVIFIPVQTVWEEWAVLAALRYLFGNPFEREGYFLLLFPINAAARASSGQLQYGDLRPGQNERRHRSLLRLTGW